MLVAGEVLGRLGDACFAGREVDPVDVTWSEAGRSRLRRRSHAGVDIATDVPRGAYLADGAVLSDDGVRVIAVRRPPEPTLVIRLTEDQRVGSLVEQAVRIGHAFGNQHVPVEAAGTTLLVPLTTSESVARATVERLGIDAAVTTEHVALGRDVQLAHGHGHREA